MTVVLLCLVSAISVSASESRMEVHFLDVGQGDCAILTCDGKSMIIDGGNADKSQLVFAYLKDHGIKEIEYLFATHPDEDHIGGLSAALNKAEVKNAFCSVTEHDSDSFRNLNKYLKKQGKKLKIPNVGDTYKLGSAKITVLNVGKNGEGNNDSLVLKVEHGKNSFLFMGDAEAETEEKLLGSQKKLIDCDVLKVGHHGSRDASTEDFIRAASPEFAVISVGENTYGHPTDEVLKRLEDSGAEIHRTDYNGHIIFTSDGKTLKAADSKKDDWKLTAAGASASAATGAVSGQAADTEKTDSEITYILNSNSGKFHYPNCKSVKKMNESNKIYWYGSRDELIEKYNCVPCKNCNP